MNRIIASESDSNREQVKTYIKYYILTSYKPMMQIYRITSIIILILILLIIYNNIYIDINMKYIMHIY